MDNKDKIELRDIHEELLDISCYIERINILSTCVSGYCEKVVTCDKGVDDPVLVNWVNSSDIIRTLNACMLDISKTLIDQTCELYDRLWDLSTKYHVEENE